MSTSISSEGFAIGQDRARAAAQKSIHALLRKDAPLRRAKAVRVNIIGGSDMTLGEIDEAASVIAAEIDPDVTPTFDPSSSLFSDGRMTVLISIDL